MNDVHTNGAVSVAPLPYELRAAALDYAAHGWKVFPLASWGKKPPFKKEGEEKGGFHEATDDEETIEAWWQQNPVFNVAWVPGWSGNIVLDFDPHSMTEEAFDLLQRLDTETPTMSISTPAKGWHRVYTLPEGVEVGNKAKGLPKGIDVRAHHGYAALPPSVVRYTGPDAANKGVPDGFVGKYEFANELPAAPIPDWLLQKILLPEPEVHPPARQHRTLGETPEERIQRSLQKVLEVLDFGEISYKQPETYEGGWKVILTLCPFNPPEEPHAEDAAAFVLVDAAGKIVAGCHHNRCMHRISDEAEGNAWKMLKRIAGWKDRALPQIVANGRQLNEMGDEALGCVLAAGAGTRYPRLYVRSSQLMRVRRHEGLIETMTPAILMTQLAQCARWVRIKHVKEEPIEIDTFPPRQVADYITALGEWDNVPALRGVLAMPGLARGGRWITEPGFDEESGLFLLEGPTLGDTTPTPENVEAAKHLILDELLGDFPFAEAASKAHAVALLLLGFVRNAIDGVTPLHLVDAPTPGTGKGLLVEAVTLPSLRDGASSIAGANNDEEWRKRLTSVLMEGATHVNLDNLAGVLDSGSLASATTSPIWKDRRLSTNETVTVPVRCIWTATANNLAPSDELARRCVWIRLDAKMERPQDRTGFRHSPLIPWVKENRVQIATAAITLVRNWQEQGGRPSKARKGSYEEWAPLMGGILEANGIPGFLDNEIALSNSVANDMQSIKEFVKKWFLLHGKEYVSIDDLMMIAGTVKRTIKNGDITETIEVGEGILDHLLGDKGDRSRVTRLGQLIGSKYRERTFTFFGTELAEMEKDADKAQPGFTFDAKAITISIGSSRISRGKAQYILASDAPSPRDKQRPLYGF